MTIRGVLYIFMAFVVNVLLFVALVLFMDPWWLSFLLSPIVLTISVFCLLRAYGR